MAEERNKSYRIRTNIDTQNDYCLNVNINQDIDTFEILSLKIDQSDTYKLHNSNYGVIVGRVVANNGFGVPNAKVSVFVSANTESDSQEIQYLYPYVNVSDRNNDGIRYNLLPNQKVSECHKAVGSFPNKTYLLDNGVLMEIFDKYYTLTTRTNEAGDYMFCGVPTGNVTLHMDCDLSDCGILSQRPRDMVYKGYNINQFESANEFKTSTELDSLKQILSQDQVVYVNPFWGNESLGETIGITRCDINLNYKFEPTCVFIGSVIGDNSSNGLSKKCVPTNKMGSMEEMVTGQGRIEMIRKTQSGEIESFSIKGTQLIDGNGTWCYQIPMNLDYVMTDEYGNIVATDDPEKGIPTRTSVRFRFSMLDFDGNSDTYLRAKILVPHNPMDLSVSAKPSSDMVGVVVHEDYDYSFGSDTRDDSFRDLLWNNVYTVKQYIPRFQYTVSNKEERFTGIKGCNYFGNNNPMPYNSIRVRLPLMFTILCALIKAYIRIITILNTVNSWLCEVTRRISKLVVLGHEISDKIGGYALESRLTAVADGLCPDLENWYFTPSGYKKKDGVPSNVTGDVFWNPNGGESDGPDWEPDVSEYTCGGVLSGKNETTNIQGIKISGVGAKYYMACNEYNGDFLITGPNNFGGDDSLFRYDNSDGCVVKDITGSTSGYAPTGKLIELTNTTNKDDKINIFVSVNVYGYETYEGSGWTGATKDTPAQASRCNTAGNRVDPKKSGVVISWPSGETTYTNEKMVLWYNETKWAAVQSGKTAGNWKNYAINELGQDDGDGNPQVNLFNQTLYYIKNHEGDAEDSTSVDATNNDEGSEGICITTKTDYLMSCVEMNLAQEYRVINFDFYNDWINGTLYFPRWAMDYKPKKSYLFGLINIKAKTKGCIADNTIFGRTRKYVQQCSLHYSAATDGNGYYTIINSRPGCHKKDGKERCHKNSGRNQVRIFGRNGGAIKQAKTMLNEDVYYYKPCEWSKITVPSLVHGKLVLEVKDSIKANLFATDIVLLGSLNDCSLYGIPQAFKGLLGSSYKMPTNLALTNMDDSGYLYGTDGVACTTSTQEDMNTTGVTRSSLSYSATEVYNSTLSGSDSFITYATNGDTDSSSDSGKSGSSLYASPNALHDLYPLTEAAGISWNYSGPGQGEKDSSKLYYPGGHFLGLSCVNSQTNIKSCINLQRMCEVGASMSQRREVIVGHQLDANNNLTKTLTDYFVPTGLISNTDITGAAFRSMFASMNAKRLIADDTDANTGYKKYSFLYLNPNGFDGKMIAYTTGSTQYNEKADTTDAKSDVEFMIEQGYSGGDDYDEDQLDRTYKKTVEIANKYYYMFRFGLTGSESKNEIRSKFLLQDGKFKRDGNEYDDYLSLPQYQNSYYFYFGLKDGATAFDRFIGDFFSECNTNDEETSNAYITITKNGLDKATGNSVTCSVFNMTMPFTCTIERVDEEEETVTVKNIKSGTFPITNLNSGTYKISVTDADGIIVSATVLFSLPEIYASYTTEDFKFKVKNTQMEGDTMDKAIARANMSKLTNSGLIELDEIVEINGENYYATGSDSDMCNVVFVDTTSEKHFFVATNKNFTNMESITIDGENLNSENQLNTDDYVIDEDGAIKIYLMTPNSDYDIYVGYKLSDGTESYVLYETEYLSGIDNMDMVVGCNYLSYSNENDEGFNLQALYDTPSYWWKKLSELNKDYPNSTWLLLHYLTNQESSAYTFDANVFCIHKDGNLCNDYILFGQPENSESVYTWNTGLGNNYVYSTKDANRYYGYSLNDTNIYHATIISDKERPVFGKMLIDDGISLSSPVTGISFTEYTIDESGNYVYTFTGNVDANLVMYNHGCIISDGENNAYAIRTSSNVLKCYKSGLNNVDLSALTIRPLFYYPILSKQFKADVNYYYWNDSEDDKHMALSSKCFGTIYNGIVDFDKKFGTSSWFADIDDMEISESDDLIKTDYEYYNLVTAGDFATSFGLTGNSVNTYTEKIGVTKTKYGNFYITEGVPTGITELGSETLNQPETFKAKVISGSSSIVFVDKILTKISGNTYEYMFTKTYRNRNAKNESGDIKYYAVIDSKAALPFEMDGDKRKVKSDLTAYTNEYYDNIISDSTKSKLIEFDADYHEMGGVVNFIIGVSIAFNESGGVTRLYKFYAVVDDE